MTATEAMHLVDSPARIDQAVGLVAAAREAAGTEMDIAVDFHGRVHRAMAKALVRELEPMRPLFIEEPVLPEHNDALREIARHTTVPLATGERLYSRWDFNHLLASGVIDIIQPDLSHAGGISEVRKIATMAEAYDVALAPHCPLGPIAFAASLQIDAVSPNAFIQEQVIDVHGVEAGGAPDYLVDRSAFRYEAGFVQLPEGPGLGIEIDEDRVREAAARAESWRNELWRNPDGTLAEW
jgi:galactonate dehydratase